MSHYKFLEGFNLSQHCFKNAIAKLLAYRYICPDVERPTSHVSYLRSTTLLLICGYQQVPRCSTCQREKTGHCYRPR
jgi:hypothetical protein